MSLKLVQDYVYEWEAKSPNQPWMTQPVGGGELRTWTWGEGVDEARRIAAYLKSLDLPEGSHIAIFSKNTAWWILADLAIMLAGYVSVPLYPTLTADTVGYVLEHSEARLVFVGKLDGYAAMAPGIPAEMPRIVMPLAPAEAEGEKWADIIERTEPFAGRPVSDPDDLQTILYTSGSTGVPKGVMLTFGAVARPAEPLARIYDTGPHDRMLSYLPLAHSFERMYVEGATLAYGVQLFFAESLETFVDDLKRARPTIFISVPRLWQKFQLGVFETIPPGRLDLLLRIPLLNRLIRRRVLEGLGLDQVRLAATGSAPIPPELIAWYRKLGLDLNEGWAMSETIAYATSNRPGHNRVGTVGQPYPGVEIRIAEDGEILCKSPGMMEGYYKDPEATARAFTEDGWLKTGDVGSVDEDGYLTITGRVKEIFKTSKGKYVAPAHIESRLQLHPEVEMACVMGSGQPQPCAVVMLSDAARARAAEEREAVREDIARHVVAVNAELPDYEKLRCVALAPSEWTIDAGLLTPTLKIRRSQMEARYGPEQPAWYAADEPVVWANT